MDRDDVRVQLESITAEYDLRVGGSYRNGFDVKHEGSRLVSVTPVKAGWKVRIYDILESAIIYPECEVDGDDLIIMFEDTSLVGDILRRRFDGLGLNVDNKEMLSESEGVVGVEANTEGTTQAGAFYKDYSLIKRFDGVYPTVYPVELVDGEVVEQPAMDLDATGGNLEAVKGNVVRYVHNEHDKYIGFGVGGKEIELTRDELAGFLG